MAAEAFSRALIDGRSGCERGARFGGRRELDVAGSGIGDPALGSKDRLKSGGSDSLEVEGGREGGAGEDQEEKDGDVQGKDTWIIPCSLRRLDLSRNGLTDEGAR